MEILRVIATVTKRSELSERSIVTQSVGSCSISSNTVLEKKPLAHIKSYFFLLWLN